MKIKETTNKYLTEKLKARSSKSNKIEDKVYDMLSGADFERWYPKDYIDHIEGAPKAKSRDDIISDIKTMLR